VIFLDRSHLKVIADAAEAAYPKEACGLLVGRAEPPGDIVVTRVVASANVAEDGVHDRFEVDPWVRLEVMRALEDQSERLVGHFHSHPDHPAQPSPRDLDMAWEPELVWLITSVVDGQAIHTTAHVLDPEGRQFREICLRTADWRPYPVRPADASR
jgi:proteasome lid subunit RPN8/RPN11